MRLLAIGDIHGCLHALDTLLDAVAPEPEDQIVTLGDYVDRGPDSRGVLDRLVALHDTGRLIALRGNHDVMFLEARQRTDPLWLACGGVETLRSYGTTDQQIEDMIDGKGGFEQLLAGVPIRHWQFLEDDCVRWHESEKHFFVHACVDPERPLDQQSDDMLYWQKLIRPCSHVSGKTMICGHTRQKNGLPLDWETTVCIDTNIYDGGWLTCLDVLSGRVWQANEWGKTRTGYLQDCREWAD
ncbi:MAG TPA: metallophosphoesterase family protein [Gemmataceae bacterium]|nr:metallophosphoesterase family protein [Gemmataceae bacterium]